MSRTPISPRKPARGLVANRDASLLDVVDNVLSKGVMLTGDLTLALADVDLIYARLSLLLCAADRVLPSGSARRASPHGPKPRDRARLRA